MHQILGTRFEGLNINDESRHWFHTQRSELWARFGPSPRPVPRSAMRTKLPFAASAPVSAFCSPAGMRHLLLSH